MWPGSSVSERISRTGVAGCIELRKIDRDQVTDYAARKEMTVASVERWRNGNSIYDPA